MHKLKPVLENYTNKILWGFKIQIDHPIPARRPNSMLINKRKIISHLRDFAVPVDYKGKIKENEKMYK